MRTINRATEADRPSTSGEVVVDLVVPVYNEAASLARQVRRLHRALQRTLPLSWRIVIADNGSIDETPRVADRLAAELPGVAVLHLAAKGRGRALRAAWLRSDAQVVAYTDVDLSTNLAALYPLVASVLSGYAEIAIGSRLLPGSRTTRGPKREFISRTYNRLLHLLLGARFRDAQCGFKALRRDVATALVPEVADQAWFFDTELLIRAERHGLRVVELPVEWVDDPDSRVDIVRTAVEDLRGVRRLLRQLGPRHASTPMARSAPLVVEDREAA